MLTSAGRNVSWFTSQNDPDAAALATLNAADLIILSRSVASGHYQQETEFWNTQVTSPVISMGGYPLRSSRLNWHTGTNIVDTAGPLTLNATWSLFP